MTVHMHDLFQSCKPRLVYERDWRGELGRSPWPIESDQCILGGVVFVLHMFYTLCCVKRIDSSLLPVGNRWSAEWPCLKSSCGSSQQTSALGQNPRTLRKVWSGKRCHNLQHVPAENQRARSPWLDLHMVFGGIVLLFVRAKCCLIIIVFF